MKHFYCLHGFLGSTDDWNPFVSEFATHQLMPIEIPTTDSWAESIRSIVDHIEPESVLCGYSMGARIGLACAMECQETQRPSKLRGLIFVSGNPGLNSKVDQEARWKHDLQVVEDLRCEPIQQFLENWYRQAVFAGFSPQQIEQWIKIRRKLDTKKQAKLMSTYSIGRQPDFWPKLKSLELPVLLLSGDRDNKYCDIAKRMCHELPDAEHHVVSDCGHMVPFEQPNAFAQLVNQFLTNRV